MRKPMSPCTKSCTNRSFDCHAMCEQYKKYQKDLYEFNCMVLANKRKEEEVKSYLINRKAPPMKSNEQVI